MIVAKAGGFDVDLKGAGTGGIVQMLGGFSILRLSSMMGNDEHFLHQGGASQKEQAALSHKEAEKKEITEKGRASLVPFFAEYLAAS